MLKGILIKESLADESVLKELSVTKTEVEKIDNAAEGQPDMWTLVSFEVDEKQAAETAKKLGRALKLGKWYVDFKNEAWVWVVFPDKVFYYQAGDVTGREVATLHAKSLGIPESQLDW